MKNKLPTLKIIICLPLLILSLLLAPFDRVEAAEKAEDDSNTLTPEKLASLDIKQTLFIYDSFKLPDPFRPFINFTQIERSIPTDTNKPLTPLEKYTLNQFNIVGMILAGNDQNYALVEDPELIGYTVREGDKIGNMSGLVIEIKSNEVVIEEPYIDIFDKQQMRTISLRLREVEEESYLNLGEK